MAATRERITEAAMELHGSVGPSRTTITAVAERAGVQRQTVYRHFATDADLFAACSGHFAAMHPRPDAEAWGAIEDPERRLARALDELYAFYEGTEAMWANIFRDEPLVPAIGPNLARFRGYLDDAAGTLAEGRPAPDRAVLLAATRHAVDFHTWRSLSGISPGGRDRAHLGDGPPRGRRLRARRGAGGCVGPPIHAVALAPAQQERSARDASPITRERSLTPRRSEAHRVRPTPLAPSPPHPAAVDVR